MIVGLVGGYGDVGTAVARQIAALGLARLRIGGRDAETAQRLAASLGGSEAAGVDAGDDAALDRFVRDCRVVLNCAGPTQAIGDRVARAALRAGADYVDVGGDERLEAALDPGEYRRRGRIAVISAGLHPGLTGLLPRWAAGRGWSRVDGLTSYFGLRDTFTPTAALDYLQAAADGIGRSGTVWRGGRHPAPPVRNGETAVPLFPVPTTLLAYLTPEAERLARALRLEHGAWYTVLCGRHVTSAFACVHGLGPEAGARLLCQASRLDLGGQTRFVLHLLQLDGWRDGRATTRTTVLRGTGNAALTGAMAAMTVAAVLRGEIPPGRHAAAAILNPDRTIPRLVSCGVVDLLTEADGTIAALHAIEEGAL
ncbi:saccharopine dehydrogenase NADP-binding domain-containing protein [Phaeospirillum tilakii]|uniref:Saccharopine dehydrogenase NADP-binding domain-containing protein n=1 Tax=Phaeospirillum tilakii TaxID=741673 RepID=A0ABW5CGI1_9PROT